MTGSERDTLRGRIDAAKRARLKRAGNPDLEAMLDRRATFAQLDAQVAARPAAVVADIAVQRAKRVYRACPYCGRPTYGAACRSHRDLLLIEQQMFGMAA